MFCLYKPSVCKSAKTCCRNFKKFSRPKLICIVNNNSEYRALPQLLDQGGVLFSGTPAGCQRKQKKSIDQRALQIGYEGIKSFRSLDMKNYLVTGGPLSLVESYDEESYL